jgi:hypothetical protein
MPCTEIVGYLNAPERDAMTPTVLKRLARNLGPVRRTP